MFSIAVIGPESTGKTTIAHQLADQLDALLFSEPGRELVEKQGYQYTHEDVLLLAREHAEREKEVQLDTAHDFAIFDTDSIINKVWLEDKYGEAPAWLNEHIENCLHDCYLLCRPDIPFVEDPARENGDRREELFERYRQELERVGAFYLVVEGRYDSRQE